MRKVAIVTDRACDIPDDLAAELRITRVPLYVSFPDRTYRDDVDITSAEILERLAAGQFPKLSQPSPGDFAAVYRRAAMRAATGCSGGRARSTDRPLSLMSIHVTARLSGIQNAARLGAGLCPDLDISIIDSRTGSMGAGWVAIEAARAALSGLDRDGVLQVAQAAVERTAIYLVVPDLIFLHRAGRLGKVSAWLGRTLAVTPVVTAAEGVAFPYALVRGRRRALDTLVEAAFHRFGAARPLRVAVVHVAAEDDARRVLDAARRTFNVVESILTHAGAAVTGGLGPGAVALCVLQV